MAALCAALARSSVMPRCSGRTATCASPRTRRRTRRIRRRSSRPVRPVGTSRCRRAGSAPAPASTRRASPRLASIRAAIDDDRSGQELERLLAGLKADGWDLGGERLKTTPRGYSADHPRIELLRHKSMTVGRSHGFEPFVHTPSLLDVVRDDWRELRPFVEWVAQNAE